MTLLSPASYPLRAICNGLEGRSDGCSVGGRPSFSLSPVFIKSNSPLIACAKSLTPGIHFPLLLPSSAPILAGETGSQRSRTVDSQGERKKTG